MKRILLGAFVRWYIDCKNRHGESNIKFIVSVFTYVAIYYQVQISFIVELHKKIVKGTIMYETWQDPTIQTSRLGILWSYFLLGN